MAFFDYELQKKLQGLGVAEYNRKSSRDREDKQIRSIEGQHEDIKQDIIKKFSLKDVKLFQESQSAFKMGRPKFNELIEEIEKGNIQVVLVWHPNRIARNYSDGGKFVQLMSDGKLLFVVTPQSIFENTARDREYLMTEFTRATRDSDDKSEAVKRGNRTKLKIGHVPSGRLSEGYIHKRNEKGEVLNASDPQRFPLLRKAIGLMLDGTHTPKEALDALNHEMGYRTRKTKRTGGNPMSESTWYKLLNDSKYAGILRRTEGEFTTDFPSLMTKDEAKKIQILLGHKAVRRTTKNEWAYTGEINCEHCGAFITQEEKFQIICSICKTKFHLSRDRFSCPNCGIDIEEMRDPKILQYIWLHCGKSKKTPDGLRCPQPSVAVENFEDQVDRLIEKMTIPEKFTKWAISWLRKLHAGEVQERTVINKNMQNLYNDVQKQIDELLDMRLKGLIENEEYQKKKETLLLEKAEVKQKLKTTDKRADDWLDLCERTFNFATYARVWFAKGSNEQKRSILHALGSNLTLNDKILSLEQRKPFLIINGMKEKISILMETFEPNEKVDLTSQIVSSDPTTLSLLPG